MPIVISEVNGDLLRFEGDAIVNPWNRNFIPRKWMNSGGVSGQLKKVTGEEPWITLSRHGLLPLGAAVVTSSGQLKNVHSLIHVAGLTARWKATTKSVTLSARNAFLRARENEFQSIAIPLIGAGTGGFSPEESRSLILSQGAWVNQNHPTDLHVTLYTPEPR